MNHTEEERIYHQKFFNIDKDAKFQNDVMMFFNSERNTIRDVVEHFRKELGAEIFQHEVDIGIGVKFVIKDLFGKGFVRIYDGQDEINYPIQEELHHHLIAEGNAMVVENKLSVTI